MYTSFKFFVRACLRSHVTHLRHIIIIIIINYFYNAHNTLQGMSLCAVRKKRLGGGTVQVHDIIEIIQIGRFFKADLKCSIELIDLKESGRLFHMIGAA